MLNYPHELREALYDIFTIILSSLALLSYNLSRYKEKKEILSKFSLRILSKHQINQARNRKKDSLSAWLTIGGIVLISLFQHGLVSPLNKLLAELLDTGTNYFGMIFAMPILLPLYCWLLGIHPFKQIDLITPAYPLALFFMKLGCFCSGCCRGMSCPFGLINYEYQKVEFPTQLLEAAIALFLFFFLHTYRKKAKEGTLLPTYIVLYCSIRFCSEFLRNEAAVWGPLKVYHILCLIGILSGLVQLVILKKYRQKIESLFTHDLPSLVFKKEKVKNNRKTTS